MLLRVLTEEADAVSSPSVIPPGNVQQLAGWVQEETGGDLFSIQVTEPYPDSWDECLSRANQERGEDARPELVQNVENLEQYDTVFLGYPNWWYGVPMALLSFLEQNDLSGKQVYLFCSHGTGGLANSVEIISEAIPEAEISDSIFDCYEEDAASSRELDTGDSPVAEGGAGTLAYYVPWGNVVMFYDDYSANGSLLELGQVVSEEELIREMSGTIVIDVADAQEK